MDVIIVEQGANAYTKRYQTHTTESDIKAIAPYVVCIVAKGEPLYDKLDSLKWFDLEFQDGVLSDVIEVDPIPVELSSKSKIDLAMHNLETTDYKIIKAVEAMLPTLLGDAMTTELCELIEERQEWRDCINENRIDK